MTLYISDGNGNFAEAIFEIREFQDTRWSPDYSQDMEENVRDYSLISLHEYQQIIDYWRSDYPESDGFYMDNLNVFVTEPEDLKYKFRLDDISDYMERMGL